MHALVTSTRITLKVRGWEKIFNANRNDKKAGVAILTPDKVDFKTKAIKKGKEEHYIMIKGSIQEEDMTLINIYVPNIGAHKYMKQILTDIKGEIDRNTIILGYFNTPLISIDTSSRQKISKATKSLNDTEKPEQTFFSGAHGTFSWIDHILGHKTSLNKFKAIEIISSIFSDHNSMKLEINHRKENKKQTSTWRLNNMLLRNQWLNNEIKEEI